MNVISTLRVSCRKATDLLERREFRALGTGERIGLWLHLRVCDACRAYERQSIMLDGLMKERSIESGDTSALEDRILRELQG